MHRALHGMIRQNPKNGNVREVTVFSFTRWGWNCLSVQRPLDLGLVEADDDAAVDVEDGHTHLA